MAEGFKIAEAFVEVVLKDRTDADMDRIRERIRNSKPFELSASLKAPTAAERRQLRDQLKQSPIEVPTSLKKPTAADLRRLRDELKQSPIELPVALKAPSAQERRRLRDELRERPIEIPVTFKMPSPQERKKFKDTTEKQPAVEVPVKLKDPIDDAWRSKLNSDLRAAAKEFANLPVRADTEEFRRKLSNDIAEINKGLSAKVPVDIDEASAWRQKLREQVDAVSSSVKARVPIEVVIDDSSARRAQEAFKRANEDIERQSRASMSEVRKSTTAAGNDIESRLGGAATRSGTQLSTIGRYAAIGLGGIGPLAGVAAAAIAAIGPAAIGAAGLIAAIGFAFGGVVGALRGYAADQDAAAGASGKSAATQLSNAMAIRDATRGISEAEKDRARAYQDAADSITDAERSVADAQENERDAQQALTEARRAAVEQLEDMNRRLANTALREEGAMLALESAQERARRVAANPLSTDLERRQAAHEVKEAEARLEDVRAADARLRRDAEDANARGVEGDRQVVAAKERVADATQATADAQADLARTHVEAADQMAAADEQVARAVERLSDVQAQQAAAAEAAAGGVSKFATAMAKLSPEARELVMQLISMKPLIDDISKSVQAATLPGFTQMFRDSVVLFPIFKAGLVEIGGILGDTARQAGALFQTTAFQEQLAANFANAMPIIRAASDGMLQVFADLIELGAQAAPVTNAIANGITMIVGGVGQFFDAIAPAMGPLGELLTAVFQIVSSLLGPLGQLVAMVVTALAPAFTALAPVVADFAQLLLSLLAPVLDAMGPLLTTIVQALGRVVEAFKPVAEVAGDFLASLGPLIGLLADFAADMLIAMAPALQKLFEALTPVVETLTTSLEPILPRIAEAFGHLWDALSELIEPLATLAVELIPIFADMLTRILDALEPLWPEIQQLAETVADSLTQAIKDLAPKLPEIVDSFVDILEALIPLLPPLVDFATLLAETVIPAAAWFIGVLMDLHAAIFGPIADAMKWVGQQIPEVWSMIKDSLRMHVDAIKSAINWFSELPDKFSDWFGRAKDAALRKSQEMMDWVRGIPRRIMESLGDTGTILYNAGADMVRGMWNGLKGMGSWLYNNVMNWVKSVIPEPIREALGIHSPSKVAEDITAEVPRGVEIALDKGRPAVEKASLRLAASVRGGLTAMGGDGAAMPVDGGAFGTASAGDSTTPVRAGGFVIEQLIVQVQGIVDLTDPYAMSGAAREMVVRLREALRQVEASQT